MFDNVFSLLIQKTNYDENKPWIQNKTLSIGTGILISWSNTKMILTNEHVVHNATYICAPSHDRIELHLRFASKVHDLALLIPDDPSAFNKFDTFEIPTEISINLGQPIQIIGFPRIRASTRCRENALVSNGTVSRLVEIEYNQSEPNVIYQLVAATDFGSSGSPVLSLNSDLNKILGVASYRLETGRTHDVRDVCYMIPISVVNHFLETFSRSRGEKVNTMSLCDLGISTSLSYSPILRNYYLGPGSPDHGVLVSGSDTMEILVGDFIMSINDRIITKNGMVWDKNLNGYVPYWYIIKMTHPGDELCIQIIRDHSSMNVCVVPRQLSLQINDGKYLQFGSMIFTEQLSLFGGFGNVILSEFTHSTKMQGYELQNGTALLKVDDKIVENVACLKQQLKSNSNSKNKFIKLEFSNGDIVIAPNDAQVMTNF